MTNKRSQQSISKNQSVAKVGKPAPPNPPRIKPIILRENFSLHDERAVEKGQSKPR